MQSNDKDELLEQDNNTENNTDNNQTTDNEQTTSDDDLDKTLDDLSKMIAESLRDSLSSDELKSINAQSVRPISVTKTPVQRKSNKYFLLAGYVISCLIFNLILTLTSKCITTDIISVVLFTLLSDLTVFIVKDLLKRQRKIGFIFTFSFVEYILKAIIYVIYFLILKNFLLLEITNIWGIIVIFFCSSFCVKHFESLFIMLQMTSFKKNK